MIVQLYIARFRLSLRSFDKLRTNGNNLSLDTECSVKQH